MGIRQHHIIKKNLNYRNLSYKPIYVFTDASVNHIRGIAVGSYYIIDNLGSNVSKNDIKHVVFNNLSSTIVEMMIIMHVLEKMEGKRSNIRLYTDCKSFCKLVEKKGKQPSSIHYQLYTSLQYLVRRLGVKVIWTKGHSPKEEKIKPYEVIFSEVDKHARRTLREIIK